MDPVKIVSLAGMVAFVVAGVLCLYRQLKIAPLMPPDYDVDDGHHRRTTEEDERS